MNKVMAFSLYIYCAFAVYSSRCLLQSFQQDVDIDITKTLVIFFVY